MQLLIAIVSCHKSSSAVGTALALSLRHKDRLQGMADTITRTYDEKQLCLKRTRRTENLAELLGPKAVKSVLHVNEDDAHDSKTISACIAA